MGMTVAAPVVQKFYLRFEDLLEVLVKSKEKDIQLLFVVLPASDPESYHEVS